MELLDLLLIQFWVGAIQLGFAIIMTPIIFIKTKELPVSLKRYWAMVFGFFFILFVTLGVNENAGEVWVLTAWGIAVYWFVHFFRWLKIN